MSRRGASVCVLLLLLPAAHAARADDLAGTYRWLGDSDGAKPNAAAVVYLRLYGGRAELVAHESGPSSVFPGRYTAGAGKVTIAFDGDAVPGSAKSQPYTLTGKTLTLPFALVSGAAKKTSSWQKLGEAVEERIEAHPCLPVDPSGAGMCPGGTLGAMARHKTCLFAVTALDGTPLEAPRHLCVLDCTDPAIDPEPAESCAGPRFECERGFRDQTIHRNFQALDPPVGKQLADLYGKLVTVATRHIREEKADPKGSGEKQRAQDRIALERRILDLTNKHMMPFEDRCTWQKSGVTTVLTGRYGRSAADDGGGFSPMGFNMYKQFEIHDFAFYKKVKNAKGEEVAAAHVFEELGAALIHESFHTRQIDCGASNRLALAMGALAACAGRSSPPASSNGAGRGARAAPDASVAAEPGPAATIAMECPAGDGRAPWNPYDEARTLRGSDGDFADACDANGDLLSYQCEHDAYPCPGRRDGRHKHKSAPCWRKTGRVESAVVDCDGHCRDGACRLRCPRSGDRLTYLQIAANGDAVFASAEDPRRIACRLAADQKQDTYDCLADPKVGGVFVVDGLGLSTTMCTGGQWGNVSDRKCTYRDCRYLYDD